jgi:3-hydroxyisobutyrate dehydrogenase-like beta-hydroxyacid dehydrogenase
MTDKVAESTGFKRQAVEAEDQIDRELCALGDGSGKIVMCLSTCDPNRIAALGERVIRRGIRFLDTPISGTSQP